MKLNEFDFENLDDIIEVLEGDERYDTAKVLKAIIRKIKRDD